MSFIGTSCAVPIGRGWPGDHREQLVENEAVASRAGINPLDKGETALWRAVIAHAIEEACGGRSHGLSGTNRDRAMDAARSWFERAGKDFRLVCDLAGLDAQAVRARAAADIESAAAPRAPRNRLPLCPQDQTIQF